MVHKHPCSCEAQICYACSWPMSKVHSGKTPALTTLKPHTLRMLSLHGDCWHSVWQVGCWEMLEQQKNFDSINLSLDLQKPMWQPVTGNFPAHCNNDLAAWQSGLV